MQLNIKTLKKEIECLTCEHDGEVCQCNIYCGDTNLPNLYKRRS